VSLASCLQTTFEEGVLLSVEVQAGAHHNQIGEVNAWRRRSRPSPEGDGEHGGARMPQYLAQSTTIFVEHRQRSHFEEKNREV